MADDGRVPPCKEGIVAVNSLSKDMGTSGWRVGYVDRRGTSCVSDRRMGESRVFRDGELPVSGQPHRHRRCIAQFPIDQRRCRRYVAEHRVQEPILEPAHSGVRDQIRSALIGPFGQKSVPRRIAGRYFTAGVLRERKVGFTFSSSEFLRRYGTVEPRASGISSEWTRKVWGRRGERGWDTLAVRLLLLARFEEISV